MRAYLQLTKPRISLLFAITGLAALVMEGRLLAEPGRLWLIVLAIFLVGGCANALNQYFEHDIDRQMGRTAARRPIPLGQVSPRAALLFALMIGALGVSALVILGGWLAALLGLGTILFYALYYTLWLKPRTPYNIVIGGLAGAMAPLIAWAAATQTLHWLPGVLTLLIFCWTPPHFWALALYCQDDYVRVGIPMHPIVKGEDATRRQIVWYAWTLLPISMSVAFFPVVGWVYLGCATALSVAFIVGAQRLRRSKRMAHSRQLFAYSILYVLLLFLVMIADALI